MDTEKEFIQKMINYCDTLYFKVGHNILDDFNRLLKNRLKQIDEEK